MYDGVIRPFFRFWMLGVFISGGACIALANFVTQYFLSGLFVARLDQFGQSLVYLSVIFFVTETMLWGVLRRAAQYRIEKLEEQILQS